LLIASRISGKKFGRVKHDITNLHIYEDHIEGVKQMFSRAPLKNNSILKLVDWVTSFDDVIGNDKHAREYVVVDNYKHLGKIHFNMAV
jgi:thymidylate synthase